MNTDRDPSVVTDRTDDQFLGHLSDVWVKGAESVDPAIYAHSMIVDTFDPMDRLAQLGVPLPNTSWPKWAGSPSYAHFTRAIDKFAITEWFGTPTNKDSDARLSPLGTVCVKASSALRSARPIVFDMAQLKALPHMQDEEAWDYAMTVKLPFDSIYFDFSTGEGSGLKSEIELDFVKKGDPLEKIHVEIAGVLFSKNDRSAHDGYCITPLVGLKRYERDDVKFVPTGEINIAPGTMGDKGLPPVRWPYKTTNTIGGSIWGVNAFLLSREIPKPPPFIELAGYTTDEILARYDRPAWPIGVSPALDKRGVLEYAEPRYNQQESRYVEYSFDPLNLTDQAMTAERALCLTTVVAASCGLAAMYFLEALNVEVVEAPLHRRDRKRAEKRGWPIASTVRVHRRVVRSDRSQSGSGEGGRLTYQTQTAGHYNHVRKGSHVRCRKCGGEGGRNVENDGVIAWQECRHCAATNGLDPDLVRPCIRRDVEGALTCPDGCRREWVPDHWRGPVDAPAIPKLRKVA